MAARLSAQLDLLVDIRVVALHQYLRIFGFAEAELAVQLVCIACRQHEATQSLQIGMRHDRRDELLAQSPAAMTGDNEHIGQITEGRRIGHYARKPDLQIMLVQSEAERIAD